MKPVKAARRVPQRSTIQPATGPRTNSGKARQMNISPVVKALKSKIRLRWRGRVASNGPIRIIECAMATQQAVRKRGDCDVR
jgi:hypothetical protein